MKVISNNNINFSGLFVAKSLKNSQRLVADNISKQLTKNITNGESYINEIKNIGFDILIIPPELYNPDAVRICIIKDFKSKQFSDGTYNYLDAKIIYEEAYDTFSPQNFYDKVKQKTSKCTFKLKDLFPFLSKNSRLGETQQ